MNKALNKQFNTHRRNKDKFLLPPIHIHGSKSSNSGNRTDGVKRKFNTKKMNSIPLERSGMVGYRSPIKVPISKRLSDPFDMGKKNYVKHFDFSIKKP